MSRARKRGSRNPARTQAPAKPPPPKPWAETDSLETRAASLSLLAVIAQRTGNTIEEVARWVHAMTPQERFDLVWVLQNKPEVLG